jgi:hypothetical protein
MSTFILRKFADLIGQGVKIDEGFKEVHVNSVAKALTEISGQEVTGTQVYNHLRKWRQKWIRVCRLKDLSDAHWDENTFTIILDDEHLLGHTKNNPKDVEFLNVPIEKTMCKCKLYLELGRLLAGMPWPQMSLLAPSRTSLKVLVHLKNHILLVL